MQEHILVHEDYRNPSITFRIFGKRVLITQGSDGTPVDATIYRAREIWKNYRKSGYREETDLEKEITVAMSKEIQQEIDKELIKRINAKKK